MSNSRQAGFVLMEVTIAVIVLATVMSWAFTGSSTELRHVGQSFERCKAERLAASRLEALRPADQVLVPGVQPFALPATATAELLELAGEQVVSEVEPGLFEVAVTVSWTSRQPQQRCQARLVTWIERRPR